MKCPQCDQTLYLGRCPEHGEPNPRWGMRSDSVPHPDRWAQCSGCKVWTPSLWEGRCIMCRPIRTSGTKAQQARDRRAGEILRRMHGHTK